MNSKGKFKLSVCQGMDLRKNHWVLQKNEESGVYYSIGSVLEPFKKFMPSFELLEFLLNDDNCFELDYKAKNGDRLELYINGITYCFIYQNHAWVVAEECGQEAA